MIIHSHQEAVVQAGKRLVLLFDSDATSAVTWARTSGPAWLSFADATQGECAGTAVAGQDGLLVVTATDKDGNVDTAGTTIRVLPAGLQIVYADVTAAAGTTVSAVPDKWGSVGRILWTLINAPAGWTIDRSTGEVTGPMASMASGVVVAARDARGNTTSTSFSLTPTPARSFEAFIEGAVDSGSGYSTLPLVANENVDRRILAPGSTAPLTVALEADPSWPELVQGTATEDPRLRGEARPGGNGLVEVRVTDADGDEAVASAWAQVTEALPFALLLPESIEDEVGDPLPANLFARTVGGQGTPTFAAVQVPASVSIDAVTGEVTGTFPTTPGASTARFVATDGAGVRVFASMSIVSTAPSFSINQGAINVAANGTVLEHPVASGGTVQSWAADFLPSWLTVNGTTGRITGRAPATASTGSFVLIAVATDGSQATLRVPYVVTQGAVTCSIPTVAAVRGITGGRGSVLVTGAPGGFTATKVSGPDWWNLASNGTYSWSGLDASDTDVSPITVRIDRTGGGTTTCTTTPSISDVALPLSCTITGPDAVAPQDSSVFVVTPSRVGATVEYTLTETAGGASISSLGGGRFRVTNTTTEGGNLTLSGTVTVDGDVSSACTMTVRSGWPITCTTPLLDVTEGTAVSGSMTGTGRPGSTLTYADTGLPSGVTMTAQGVFSGGASLAVGFYQYTVTVTDSYNSLTATCAGSFDVYSRTTEALTCTAPNVTVATGSAVTGSATGAGGNSPYTFSASGLPSGITMSSAGALSGTAGSVGTTNYTVTVTDANSRTNTCTGTIVVTRQTLTCTAPSVSVPTGTSPSGSATASGGTSPYTYAASGLPSGITMSSAGALGGTAGAVGSTTYTVTVTDAASNTAQCSGTINVTSGALDCAGPSAVVLTGGTLTGSASASGGTGPYTYAASNLPSWATMDSTGSLSGTAPSSPSTTTFSITVTDSVSATATCSGTITVVRESLNCSTPNVTTHGEAAISGSATATGGDGTYTFAANGLPAGITMSSTGALTGTTTVLTAQTFNYTVTVTDGEDATATCRGTITVTRPPLQCTVPTLNVNTGQSINAQMSAKYGTVPYTYSATGLPTGVTLSSVGRFTGSVSTAGTTNFTVTVEDDNDNTATCAGTIVVTNPPLTCSATPSPTGNVGATFSGQLPAPTGATGTVTYSKATGPSWVTVTSGGRYSGTFPTSAGTASWSYTATASNGSCTGALGTLTYRIVPLSCSADDVTGFRNEVLFTTLEATGGSGSGYTYALNSTGTHASIRLTGSTVSIPAQSADGTFNFSVTVTDSAGNTATCSGTITVRGVRLTLTLPVLRGDPGETVSGTATATGGSGSGYVFALASGPSWLTKGTGGSVSGTIPLTESRNTTEVWGMTVTDSAGTVASAEGEIQIGIKPLAASISRIWGRLNQIKTTRVDVSGGTQPYTYAVTSNPPSGSVTVADTGIIRFTYPSRGASGTRLPYTIRVQDAADGDVSAVGNAVIITPRFDLTCVDREVGVITPGLTDTTIGVATLTFREGVDPRGFSTSVSISSPVTFPYTVNGTNVIVRNADMAVLAQYMLDNNINTFIARATVSTANLPSILINDSVTCTSNITFFFRE